jgi:gamma-glutamyltranspeptidase/glutathione hydrolase
MDITTGRPVTLAPSGMVACPHALASAAGVDVLRAGGSAVDAAIATSAVLSVTYPHMTGVGGDAFWLIHDARTRRVRFLDGGGRAASAATIAAVRGRGLDSIPLRGIVPATLTVPGSVGSWGEAHRACGRLPLTRCLEAAIGYAQDGFPVTARVAGFIERTRDELAAHADAAALLLPGGEPPRAGSLLRNPGLARTLTAIANEGADGFYRGEVGRRLAAFCARHGGFFTAEDLAAQHAFWGEPLTGRYRDVTIHETPAPTQGFAVLQMLALLEPFELHRRDRLGPDVAHLMVQAKQLAYHDRDRFLADPRFVDVPIDALLSPAHLARRRALIDPARALPWDAVPSYGSLAGDTVYVAAVDAEGNAASLIQSLYGVFGSAVVAGDTGVVLQNRSAYFSLDPAHPNALQPRKTPLHTLIASMAFRDDRLWAVLGCMGADGQPQIHLHAYLNLIDHGLDVQAAIEAPRWLSGRFAIGEDRDTLHIESRYPAATLAELERRGHRLDRWGPFAELAGHAHGVVIDPASGVRAGGSDPRSDGAAIGY